MDFIFTDMFVIDDDNKAPYYTKVKAKLMTKKANRLELLSKYSQILVDAGQKKDIADTYAYMCLCSKEQFGMVLNSSSEERKLAVLGANIDLHVVFPATHRTDLFDLIKEVKEEWQKSPTRVNGLEALCLKHGLHVNFKNRELTGDFVRNKMIHGWYLEQLVKQP